MESYLRPQDASRCAVRKGIGASRLMYRQPYWVFRKFFLDMVTLLVSRSTVNPIISSCLPHSVLSSVTADDPSRCVHVSLARTRSPAKSSSKQIPMMSSTYISTALLRVWDSSYLMARVTRGWSARPPVHPCDLKVYEIAGYFQIVPRLPGGTIKGCTHPSGWQIYSWD